MSVRRLVGSTPLDDFLAGTDSSTETGELLQKIGLIGSLTGITLATGLIVFLAVVHRGSRSEIRVLLRVVGGAGAVAAVGAVVEIAGAASILDIGWADAVTDSSASSAMMRLIAGTLILLGLVDHSTTVERHQASGSNVDDVAAEQGGSASRWVGLSASAFAIAGSVTGLLAFGFDGHTVTEGPRVVHALVNFVHVAAGSVWFGGIVGLMIVGLLRRRTDQSAAPLTVRFSSVATVALIAVTAAGALMSLMITDGFGDYTGTDWGRTLIIKTVGVGIAVLMGAYNHFVVVPALESDPDAATMQRRARTTVSIEAILLFLVAIATVFLTVASTN